MERLQIALHYKLCNKFIELVYQLSLPITINVTKGSATNIYGGNNVGGNTSTSNITIDGGIGSININTNK